MNALELVISALQAMKQVHEDISFSNENCKHLAKHCDDLSFPVYRIRDNQDLLNSNSAALKSALDVLKECRVFCEKFRNRGLLKSITHHNRDREKFIALHRRLDSATHSFSLQLAADLTMAMQDREQKAKAQRDHMNHLLMQLLQAQGKEKEFMALPEDQRKGYLDRAQAMSDNLRDLMDLDLDLDESEDWPPATPSASQPQRQSSRRTKLSVLNALVEDIDLALLRHWSPNGSPEPARRLGTGSFGTVYRAEYNGREVALKHFGCLADPHTAPSAKELNKVRKEACILQHCATHRNVIGFYGLDLKTGIMLMELATCSLNAVLFGRESLFKALPAELDREYLTTFAYKASVVNDIAGALHFLHFHNIVHRDIKSQNIIMVLAPPAGMTPMALVPKLSDFGLAKAAGDVTGTDRTTEGRVGTIPYNSPEVLNPPEGEVPQYTPAADIYALGILANEMFTEKQPWKGTPEGTIINYVCYQSRRPPLYQPPANETLQRKVMEEVVGNKHKGCLAQNPAHRPTAKFLSYESKLLREASVHRVRPPIPNADSTSAAPPRRPSAATEATQSGSAQNDEIRFRAAFAQARSDSKVNVKQEFYDELTGPFRAQMANFEVFALEAAEVLSAMYKSDGEECLVSSVLQPLHQTIGQYVSQKLKDRVYQDDPALLIQEVGLLSAAEIKRLMLNMGTTVNELHTQMVAAAEQGTITDDGHSLRIPQLVSVLLRAYALAAVSEPKCCMVPAPGERLPFRRIFNEVFSPGKKRYGTIKDSEEVQVVWPGLYIEGADVEATLASQPLIPCSVRRLTKPQTKSDPSQRRSGRAVQITADDTHREFMAAFQNFETFACDAVDCLSELRYDGPTDMFVAMVMGPIFQTTLRWVTERSEREVYRTQPGQIITDISKLSDNEIWAVMESVGPKVVQLHTTMLSAAAKKIITDEPDSLRIPRVIRYFLRFHAMARLAEPKVQLTPIPGERIPHRTNSYNEILSPGVRKYGRIKEGETVEVVLCGVERVYEGNESPVNVRPPVPCLVRRLITAVPEAAPSPTPGPSQVVLSQAEVKEAFCLAMANFEPFACEAVESLEAMKERDATQTFVWRVMAPLHNVAEKYVRERLSGVGLTVADTDALEVSTIEALMREAEPMLMQLHFKMLDAEEEGVIESGPDCLRIPELLKRLLKLHAMAALSSPRCYLYPAPGLTMQYRSAQCDEVLSPGAKVYGRIQDGDAVETVLCGLYFQDPSGRVSAAELVRPMVQCRVRRMVTVPASSSSKSNKVVY